jgi:hypothetical protein
MPRRCEKGRSKRRMGVFEAVGKGRGSPATKFALGEGRALVRQLRCHTSGRCIEERGQFAPARFAVLFFERRRRGPEHSVSTEVSKACSDQLTLNLTFWHDRRCADAGCARTDLASMKNALRHLGPRDPRVPSREKRDQWIKEIAYYKAMNRRFIPGHELVDWLAAEQEVDALCGSVAMT